MAGKKENLKSLFTNTRSRVIIIFTGILLVIAVVVGFAKFFSFGGAKTLESTTVETPGIQSIPGALNPTAQYAKLQETQNENQASKALTTGNSAIPTIIRSQAIGKGVGAIGSETGQTGVGFSSLMNESEGGARHTSWILELKSGNCNKATVAKIIAEGAKLADIRSVCTCAQLKDNGYKLTDLQNNCSCPELKAAGFNALQLKNAGFTAASLQICGFDACELKNSGFSAQKMREAGFSNGELRGAGFSPAEIAKTSPLPKGVTEEDIRKAGCTKEGLAKLRSQGVTAASIRRISGCSAAQLKAAGYTDAELKDAGYTLAEKGPLGDCSVASLKAARAAGMSASVIRQTRGCSAAAMKAAGFTAAELRAAGFTAAELKAAGFSEAELKAAGFSDEDLRAAGFAVGTEVAGLPVVQAPAVVPSTVVPAALVGPKPISTPAEIATSKQLQAIMERQSQQLTDQRYQQLIQQRTSEMLSNANETLQKWREVATQSYVEGTPPPEKPRGEGGAVGGPGSQVPPSGVITEQGARIIAEETGALIKTGDILFAVVDTSVNSDEPSPILATVVAGRFKGAKLIGSFNLPNNANKMIITFNTMSVPGADRSTSISAVAIDTDTARTALSSDTNHHYLSRYGSLFAASFLQGFGNAFQSANTTITIGGTTAGPGTTTISNGINRSALENAVIGLATVGQNWAQVAQKNVNRPITVQVFSGTSIGVLFTQDLTVL